MKSTLFEHVGGNQFKLAELDIDKYESAANTGAARGDEKGKRVEDLARKRILFAVRKYGIPMQTVNGNQLIVLFRPNVRIVNFSKNESDDMKWRIPGCFIEQTAYKRVSTSFDLNFVRSKFDTTYKVYFAHLEPNDRIRVDRRLANEIFKKIGGEFVKVDPIFKSPNSLYQG